MRRRPKKMDMSIYHVTAGRLADDCLMTCDKVARPRTAGGLRPVTVLLGQETTVSLLESSHHRPSFVCGPLRKIIRCRVPTKTESDRGFPPSQIKRATYPTLAPQLSLRRNER